MWCRKLFLVYSVFCVISSNYGPVIYCESMWHRRLLDFILRAGMRVMCDSFRFPNETPKHKTYTFVGGALEFFFFISDVPSILTSYFISTSHACAKNFSTHFYSLIVSTFDDWSMLTRARQVDGHSSPKSPPRAFLDCNESSPARKFYECNSWTLRTCEFAMERRRDFALAAWIEKR